MKNTVHDETKFLEIMAFVLAAAAITIMLMGCGNKTINYNASNEPTAPFLTPQPVYLGCYSDQSTRALPAFLIQTGATVESCITTAKASGYLFAGVQYGTQCFAGNSIGYNPLPSSDCNMPCQTNSSEICGGVWTNSVYFVGQ